MNLMSRMFGASRGGRSKEEPQADMSSAALLDAATAIGMDILSRAAGELGIAPEEAAAIIGPDGGIPSSIEAISARAAQALAGMQNSGELKLPVEAYLKDPAFADMLKEMPYRAAVRLYDATRLTDAADERMNGALDVIEKLKARRSLPSSMRPSAPVSGERDYAGMSGAQFRRLKELFRKSAADGNRVRL